MASEAKRSANDEIALQITLALIEKLPQAAINTFSISEGTSFILSPEKIGAYFSSLTKVIQNRYDD